MQNHGLEAEESQSRAGARCRGVHHRRRAPYEPAAGAVETMKCRRWRGDDDSGFVGKLAALRENDGGRTITEPGRVEGALRLRLHLQAAALLLLPPPTRGRRLRPNPTSSMKISTPMSSSGVGVCAAGRPGVASRTRADERVASRPSRT
jgi:hypothetical protein